MAGEKSSSAECRIVGRVRSQLTDRRNTPTQGSADLPPARIDIEPGYREAIFELHPGAAAQVLTWLHEADRGVLQCHPRGDPSRPMRGVFSTRSPDRPNPIGLHPVRILTVEDLTLTVHPLEALDGTPVLDIKPLISADEEDPPWGPDIPAEVGEAFRFVGREAWHRGLVNGRNGNLSLRRENGRMVITRHGSAKGRLAPGDLIDADMGALSGALQSNMSSEGLMHAEIYRRQPRAGAVLHTHPPSLLALSLLHSGRRMLHLPLCEAGALAEELAVVPAREPGTQDLALAVGRAAEEKQAVFMQAHGLVCWGEDLNRALDLTEELEGLARVQLVSGG
ncbi:MAG: tRNA (N6-threonylcarbamoyladenosine(37)-N6)-methyltransferase TrmO [Desulfohalobiaceae bacterium]|nr:tRNA (N6-threonylcarbamoyladenosine(37)-N6)-methyltransferase TrmO [Desulfohalobiaceae bacterium]